MPKKSRGAYLKWRKDKKAWYIYEYRNGREGCRSTGTDDLKTAERELADYIIESSRPDHLHAPSERQIADVLADYTEERGVHLKSQKTFINCCDKLLDYWAKKTAGNVTENTCRDYHSVRNRGFRARLKAQKQPERDITPSQVARELSVLQAALTHDWKKGRITQYIHVWQPKFDNRKDRWLTQDEVGKLLDAAEAMPEAKNYLPLFILLGVYTGARHSAILQLTWDRVDLERGTIDFNDPSRERTKKGRSLIRIPMPLRAVLKVAEHDGPYVVQRAGKGLLSVKKAFGECCAKVGLVGVSPHTLRHTCASWQAQDGVSFAKIGKYLGHSDSATTEKRYSHHAVDYMDDSVRSLDARPITRPKKKNGKRKTGKAVLKQA